MTLRIEHTAAGGTVLLGTAKSDGAAQVLRAAGCPWRWSRNIGAAGAWYVPHSRDRAPGMWHIDQSAEALRAAGFSVEVAIDAAPRAMEQAEAERAQRMDDRAQRLTDRTTRRHGEAEARYAAGRQLAERIPFGQPILVGHHSERRARADQRRIRGHLDASGELWEQASAAEAGAESAAGHMRFRHNPGMVARRIERLEAERRKAQRELDGYTRNHRRHDGSLWMVDTQPPADGEHREQLMTEAAYLDEQLRYWRDVLDQARAAGQWQPFEAQTIRAGDRVKYRGRWLRVVRVNKVTVSVETDYSWTDKVPLREITEHKPGSDGDGEQTD